MTAITRIAGAARRLRRPVVAAAGIALVFLVMAMLFEDRFIYFPMKYPSGWWDVDAVPAVAGRRMPCIEDCWFSTDDGLRLHGWFCTPCDAGPDSRVPVPTAAVLLWFHGNAGNLTHRYPIIEAMMTIPVQTLIVDYRGYGRSEGKPSESGLYRDARAAWRYLVQERGIAPGRIVVYGNSLGGAVAIDLVTEVSPAALIVQSSFTSIADMARISMPLVPRFLIRTKMDSVRKVAGIRCPKLFLHSPNDEVVPFRLGRRLFEAAAEPKEFFSDLNGARHNDALEAGGEKYLEALRRFIHQATVSAEPS